MREPASCVCARCRAAGRRVRAAGAAVVPGAFILMACRCARAKAVPSTWQWDRAAGCGRAAAARSSPRRACSRRPATWPDPVAAVPLRRAPLILADYTADPYSVPMLTTVAGTLATVATRCWSASTRTGPTSRLPCWRRCCRRPAARPWMTLACRDRNRIVLEQELHGLRRPGRGRRAVRHRRRPRLRRPAGRDPGLRPGRAPAGRAGRVGRPDGGGPGDAGRAAPGPAPGPAGPEAAGGGGGRGAQPRRRGYGDRRSWPGPPRPG